MPDQKPDIPDNESLLHELQEVNLNLRRTQRLLRLGVAAVIGILVAVRHPDNTPMPC